MTPIWFAKAFTRVDYGTVGDQVYYAPASDVLVRWGGDDVLLIYVSSNGSVTVLTNGPVFEVRFDSIEEVRFDVYFKQQTEAP